MDKIMFYTTSDELFIISQVVDQLEPIINTYYPKDIVSHGRNHILSVMYRAIKFNYILNLKLDIKEIVISTLLHDMYQNNQRDLHHQLAYEYVMKSTHKVFDGIDRKRVAHAVLEHRASYKGKYYSLLSELIASADRSYPDLYKIVERCFVYTIETNPNMSIDEIGLAVKKHIKEKYSKDGYIKYPKLYLKMYSKEIEKLHNDVDMFLNGEKLVIIEHNGSTITLGTLPLL